MGRTHYPICFHRIRWCQMLLNITTHHPCLQCLWCLKLCIDATIWKALLIACYVKAIVLKAILFWSIAMVHDLGIVTLMLYKNPHEIQRSTSLHEIQQSDCLHGIQKSTRLQSWLMLLTISLYWFFPVKQSIYQLCRPLNMPLYPMMSTRVYLFQLSQLSQIWRQRVIHCNPKMSMAFYLLPTPQINHWQGKFNACGAWGNNILFVWPDDLGKYMTISLVVWVLFSMELSLLFKMMPWLPSFADSWWILPYFPW